MFGKRPKRIRKLQRLRHYNYSSPGWYFITICTRYMAEWFGDVVADKMVLNASGEIAKNVWLDIPKHYTNVTLDAFVVMPNHVHGIIVIRNDSNDRHVGTEQCSVPTATTSNPASNFPVHEHYGLVSKMVMSYKNITTKQIHNDQRSFVWQRSYYDHIIRDDTALNNIRRYIINNPNNWKQKK